MANSDDIEARRAARRAAKRKRAIRNRIICGLVILLLLVVIIILIVSIASKNSDSGTQSTDSPTITSLNPTGGGSDQTGSVDVTAPIILGTADKTIKLGGSISYKEGVTVSDDIDPNPTLDIDASKVDVSTPGTYEVSYTATDASGNSSVVKINVTIESNETDPATDEEIAQMKYLADLYLKQIVKDGMSDTEKARNIWLWVNYNADYVATSDKSSWVRGALQYFNTHKGDCFNYFAAAKALLEQAGIETVDVLKSDTSHSSHFWSLVNLGDGWYHFDTTPRDGSGDYFFLVTDEQLDTYSEAHGNSHIFDHDAYPTRATKVITDLDAQPDYYDYFDE